MKRSRRGLLSQSPELQSSRAIHSPIQTSAHFLRYLTRVVIYCIDPADGSVCRRSCAPFVVSAIFPDPPHNTAILDDRYENHCYRLIIQVITRRSHCFILGMSRVVPGTILYSEVPILTTNSCSLLPPFHCRFLPNTFKLTVH